MKLFVIAVIMFLVGCKSSDVNEINEPWNLLHDVEYMVETDSSLEKGPEVHSPEDDMIIEWNG